MRLHDPLSIALFTYSTQPRGGVAHVLALGEALQRAGHDACVFAIDRPGARFSREPACATTVLTIESFDEGLFDFVRRRSDALARALACESRRFDVYHAHDGISADALRRSRERGTIGAYVRTVHHLADFGDPRVDAIERASIEGARRVFAVSRTWQRELRERFGIDALLAGNGVDPMRFFPGAVPQTRHTEGPQFLTIGGVEARKNTIALLDAFALVKRQFSGAHLTIAGGSSVLDHATYRDAFERRAAELDLVAARDYEVLPRLGDDALLARLQSADAFVFPSLVEGFGLVVLEALACGLPTVVSGVAPFVDYLESEDVAFVDPLRPQSIAAGMVAAVDARAAARYRTRGPHVAARFSWDAVAAAYVGGYRA